MFRILYYLILLVLTELIDTTPCMALALGGTGVLAGFHTATSLLSLRAHLPESVAGMPEVGILEFPSTPSPLELHKWYEAFITHPHCNTFWDEVERLIRGLAPNTKYCILLQPEFSNGKRVTLGSSFLTDNDPNMEAMKEHFTPLITKLEDDYNEDFCGQTRVKVRSTLTSPGTQPAPKSAKRPTTAQILETMQSSMQAQTNAIIEAIKNTPQPTPSPSLLAGVDWTPILQAGVSALASTLGIQVSAPTPTPTPQPSAATAPGEVQTTAINSRLDRMEDLISSQNEFFQDNLRTMNSTINEMQDVPLHPHATARVNALTSEVNSIREILASQGQAAQARTLETLAQGQAAILAMMQGGTPTSTPSNGGTPTSPPANGGTPPSSPSEGGTPTSPPTNAATMAMVEATGAAIGHPITYETQESIDARMAAKEAAWQAKLERESGGAPPVTPQPPEKALPEITPSVPYESDLDLSKIVTADLESLILPDGSNKVYMAAWYNGKESKIFDITSYGYNTEVMLQEFWLNLINCNRGSTLYFHNWAGYDAILSLIPLVGLHEHGLSFKPIVQNNQVLSLTVLQMIKGENKIVLTIKDSLKMIPGPLGKLAKEFQVPTQKDHFPHYFLLDGDISQTLTYSGPIPAYEYFEPKRTSKEDYEEMVEQFKGGWNYLEVSREYILGDVLAQYQIIIKFFQTLREAFPINPTRLLSAPGTAFKIWKTVQLPLLNNDLLKVYDLSRSLDTKFRGAYLGGIVDVYRPHLNEGQGFYYDVNSLYPTAMCREIPVGLPTPTTLTDLDPTFFGYLQATVKAPAPDTPGGYIGLLPIKLGGRLVCPGGEFSGFFFSEELRFALANGYKLLNIGEAWLFQRGENTFRALIEKLNAMKVQAQKEGKPVLRNLAKLLMNSMYGRFGMHTPEVKHAIVNPQQLDDIVENYLVLEKITLGTLELITYILNRDLLDFSEDKETKLLRKYLKGIPGQTNVPIAAAVTAYSRMIINEFKLLALSKGLDIFYSDTDSLVVNGVLPPEYCDSAKLGQLKLEHTFREGIFASPKIYYLELEDGTTVTKCKGYSGKLSKAQYLELLEGHALDLTVTRWRRSLAEGSLKLGGILRKLKDNQMSKYRKEGGTPS
uniref:Probable DNA polymerase n=1 Tax=Glomus cerebriforme TaxID=658196 RepID=S4UJM9_9GLOM|nr:truncated DNA polymerase [Glomus cerebriforme]AGJ98100.1 truncated DNA polymerase [Glomus cerebriforme]